MDPRHLFWGSVDPPPIDPSPFYKALLRNMLSGLSYSHDSSVPLSLITLRRSFHIALPVRPLGHPRLVPCQHDTVTVSRSHTDTPGQDPNRASCNVFLSNFGVVCW